MRLPGDASNVECSSARSSRNPGTNPMFSPPLDPSSRPVEIDVDGKTDPPRSIWAHRGTGMSVPAPIEALRKKHAISESGKASAVKSTVGMIHLPVPY